MKTKKAENEATTTFIAKRPFLTLDEAAGEIYSTRRFIEMRIEDGEIPVFRPSARLVRIARNDFEKWIAGFTSAAPNTTPLRVPELSP